MIHNSIIPRDGGVTLKTEVEPKLKWVEFTPATTLDSSYGYLRYINGRFVRNTGYQIAYSDDGANWTKSSLAGTNWSSPCYGGGIYVMVYKYYSLKKAAYSKDGITWTETTMPVVGGWTSVCYGAGKFVAISEGNNNYTKELAAYSTDGITWYKGGNLPTMMNWTKVCYGGGIFLAIPASKNSSNTLARSTNGISWSGVDALKTDGSVLYPTDITYAAGKFIVTNRYGEIYHSTDGITWTLVPNAMFPSYQKDGICISRSNGSSSAYYSTDAVNWTKIASTSAWWGYPNRYGDGKFLSMYGDGTKAAFLDVTYKELV